MKRCSKCGIEKDESCFSNRRDAKDRLRNQCKDCLKKYQRDRYTKPEVREVVAGYHRKNISKPGVREAKNEQQKRYRSKPDVKEARAKYDKDRDANPETKTAKAAYNKKYHARPEVREATSKKQKEHYANPEVRAAKAKYRREQGENPEFKAVRAERLKDRRKTDPFFKLRSNLQTRIGQSLRSMGYSKKSKTFQLLGISFELIKNYLEYTWFQNYGTEYSGQPVHIDHIIPCSSAKTEEELITLQHYSNLQYLTPEDNLVKGDRITQSPSI